MKFANVYANDGLPSRLPHGRRGLKLLTLRAITLITPSPPAWEAGIEISTLLKWNSSGKSPPAWEAGIEMVIPKYMNMELTSPPAWEAGIEMLDKVVDLVLKGGRLPHGRRGLK